jgi:nicotinate-nucleotide adenylyltransferase
VTTGKEISATATPGGGDTTSRARIGIFGGTFDPPHLGHQRALEACNQRLGLDELRVMVAGDPWQKSARSRITPAPDRLAMARLAFSGLDGVVVDGHEVDRRGPSFTIDTLEALSAPGRTLILILGEDAAAGLSGWHRATELPALAELAVVARTLPGSGGMPVDGIPDEVRNRWRIHEVPMEPVPVASTELRQRLASGVDMAGLMDPAVVDYARAHGLYREDRDEP